VRFRTLALDYDGTIALDGRIEPEVAAALAELRARGVKIVLVTGRILNDLRCRLGSLRAFDAVVAEEGAVLAFPPSGTSRLLGPPPPEALLAALRAQGMAVVAGQCLVECDSELAPAVLARIRALELPLVIHFNRGRMMVLPQAVSKATGLREALRTLRLSAHNALGIGDAENDHELLHACEVGVAVEWGSAALRRAADAVLEGSGPQAVAAYVRARAADERLPAVSRRHRLLLGRRADGTETFLQMHGGNVLITGDPLSGKSWLAGLLAEQMVLQGYSLCVIDPEGDYGELGALPGVRMLGHEDALPSARDLERLFAHPDASAVIDLSRSAHADKPSYVSWLAAQLGDLRRRTGLPHAVLVDEAHYFLHEPARAAALDLEMGGYLLVSYQASRLDPRLLRACAAIFVTRETDVREAGLLHELRGAREDRKSWQDALASLELDEAVLLPGPDEAGAGQLLRFRLSPRLTHHVRHEHKYLDAPLAEHLAFRFAPGTRLEGRAVRTLREFLDVLDCARVEEIDGHLRAGDFSRWVRDVFRDAALADRLGELEELHRAGRLADVNGALIHAVQERYRVEEPPAWPVRAALTPPA
jgi:hydroxymethylpyrimidine pyrophosphatase-like HAD family hydrolase